MLIPERLKLEIDLVHRRTNLMSTIRKNIIIVAPPEQVWEVVGDPAQWQRFNPNVTQYTYTLSENGGYTGAWVYRLGKLTLSAKIRTNIYEPNRRLVVETCGQMKSNWIWWLESDDDWTHLSLTLEYTAKWAGIGAVLHNELIEDLHSQTLDTCFSKIKQKVESLKP